MSTHLASFLSACAGAVLGAGAVMFLSPRSATPPAAAPTPVAEARLQALQRRIDAIEADLAQHAQTAPARHAVADRIPGDELDAAVRRVLLASGFRPDADHASGDGDPSGESAPRPPSADVVAQLVEQGVFADASEAIWERAEEEDRLDEILDAFERWAAARPGSAEARVELARAYRAAGMQRPDHPEGTWWVESDANYDRALELDPTNWDARFEKAVTLTRWPDMFGRGPEAVRHFEILVDQQRASPPSPRHAEAYLYLGNLLAQTGRADRAREIWAEGSRRFPDHAALRGRLVDENGR